MKTKHTPGPWTYEYGAVYEAGKGRLILADRDNPETSPTERDANVRACAALPDLLTALEEISQGPDEFEHSADIWEELEACRRVAQAAIAKAKGE